MRAALGDGYVDALRKTIADVPSAADYVMYWWNKAGKLISSEKIVRFGFITTNSVTQPFNRRVVEVLLSSSPTESIVFAVPDHPWVDSADGAAVRIAMTVVRKGDVLGRLLLGPEGGKNEKQVRDIRLSERIGKINANLTIGARLGQAHILRSNSGLANQGVTPLGKGFRLTCEQVEELGYLVNDLPSVIRHYLIGRDLTSRMEERYIIDFFNFTEQRAAYEYPRLFQWIMSRVKPERDQKQRKQYRERWWVFAEPRATLRPAIFSIRRYLATCRTARHRFFVFVASNVVPDAKIVAVGLDDAHYLGVLSSSLHLLWSDRIGGRLGVGNDLNYNHSDCFGKFPFPDCSDALKSHIRALGERLDAHCKARQAEHPDLTMTQMYNVLEKLRAGEALTAKEKDIHEKGLISVLKQIHDDLDASVLEAYGWPGGLSDDEILERLVALNRERAAEERQGLVRWLRPEFQAPEGAKAASQGELAVAEAAPAAAKAARAPWPKGLAAQAQAVRLALAAEPGPRSAAEVARAFQRADKARVEEILDTLASLGQARMVGEDRYAA